MTTKGLLKSWSELSLNSAVKKSGICSSGYAGTSNTIISEWTFCAGLCKDLWLKNQYECFFFCKVIFSIRKYVLLLHNQLHNPAHFLPFSVNPKYPTIFTLFFLHCHNSCLIKHTVYYRFHLIFDLNVPCRSVKLPVVLSHEQLFSIKSICLF